MAKVDLTNDICNALNMAHEAIIKHLGKCKFKSIQYALHNPDDLEPGNNSNEINACKSRFDVYDIFGTVATRNHSRLIRVFCILKLDGKKVPAGVAVGIYKPDSCMYEKKYYYTYEPSFMRRLFSYLIPTAPVLRRCTEKHFKAEGWPFRSIATREPDLPQ